MSNRRTRGPRGPRAEDLHSADEADPKRFFGELERSRKANWKTMQLCKQVERAAAITLAERSDSDSLQGAVVCAVQPAPDQGRLMVIVVLDSRRGAQEATEAKAALLRLGPAFREEVAGSVHRKRVPELVFDVRLAEEVTRG